MAIIFVSTVDESPWIPEWLPCTPQRRLKGPNRSDYLLVTVSPSAGRYPEKLVLATRHEDTSLDDLPGQGSIPVYILQLRRSLAPSLDTFAVDDIERWQLGSASRFNFAGRIDPRHL